MEYFMKQNVRGALLSLSGGICWGLSGSMGQYMFHSLHMDSRWLVPIRLGAAGVILLVFCLVRLGPRMVVDPWRKRRDRRDLLVYGLLGVSLCQFLYFLTIQLSTAGAATILQDLSPIMILLYTCITSRRTPKLFEIVSIAMALLGIFFITCHGNLHTLSIPLPALVTGVLCAVAVMIYNVTPEHLMTKYPVVLLQGWAFLMGSAAIALIFRSWTIPYVPDVRGLFGIAFVVLVGNVLAFPLYIQGVKLIGPEKGILYGFSEPVTAAIVGVIAFHNAFTLWDLLGFALVFGMLALISFGGKHAEAVRKERVHAA